MTTDKLLEALGTRRNTAAMVDISSDRLDSLADVSLSDLLLETPRPTNPSESKTKQELLELMGINSMDLSFDRSTRNGSSYDGTSLDDLLNTVNTTFQQTSISDNLRTNTTTAAAAAPQASPALLPVTVASTSATTKRRNWTKGEDALLVQAVEKCGSNNWRAVAACVPSRTNGQCAERWGKYVKPGLKKGHWTTFEDNTLMRLVQSGMTHWPTIAEHIPGRTSKQVRERWCKYLNPSLNRSPFTASEDAQIVEKRELYGAKWTMIAKEIGTGRTGEAIKHRWKALENKAKREGEIQGLMKRHRESRLSSARQNDTKRQELADIGTRLLRDSLEF